MRLPTPEELGIIPLPTLQNNSDIYASNTQDISASIEEIREAARQSLDFLSALAMPEVYRFDWPPLFQAAWKLLLENIHDERYFPQILLGLPRGFAKTTFIKLFCFYCILYTQKKFILYLGETSGKAENAIADIERMLNEPNILNTFGDWKLGIEKNTQKTKVFGFRGRNIILAALGRGGDLRGLNLGHARPDIMIFDDIQSREDAESEIISNQIETWMLGTAMKAKSPFGCIFIFLANMYPTRWSLLKKLKKNPTWIKFIVGGILADGTSLWEDLQPIEQLLREYQNDAAAGKPEIFHAEVLNDEEATTHNLIDLDTIPPTKVLEDDIPGAKFIIIDPSTHKAHSDSVAIGYFEVHEEIPILCDLIEERMSPGETIHNALQLAFKHGCAFIAAESNAYQSTLLWWFDYIMCQMNIEGIDLGEVYSGTKNKNSRIMKILQAYARGEVNVLESMRPQVHHQITQFNPIKTDNIDNTLDLITYAPKVIELYGEFITNTNIINTQELRKARVQSVYANSAF